MPLGAPVVPEVKITVASSAAVGAVGVGWPWPRAISMSSDIHGSCGSPPGTATTVIHNRVAALRDGVSPASTAGSATAKAATSARSAMAASRSGRSCASSPTTETPMDNAAWCSSSQASDTGATSASRSPRRRPAAARPCRSWSTWRLKPCQSSICQLPSAPWWRKAMALGLAAARLASRAGTVSSGRGVAISGVLLRVRPGAPDSAAARAADTGARRAAAARLPAAGAGCRCC